MSFLLSPICNEQQSDLNGAPLSGGTIDTYLAGSSTPAPTYTDITGANPQTNPIVLNTLGLAPSAIWLDSSLTYKFVVKNSVGMLQRTIDNISGISSAIPTQDQWVIYSAPPTFIDATHLSLAGDQTSIFQPGRRVKTVNTGGVVYSTILTSVFGAVTTLTLVNDAGASLDAGLSQISYALLTNLNPSIPATYARNAYLDFTGVPTLVTTGVAPTYVLTTLNNEKFLSPFVLTARMRFRVIFHAATAVASTLNINGAGAKSIVVLDRLGNFSSPLIPINLTCDLEYDGTSFIMFNNMIPNAADTSNFGTVIRASIAEDQTGSDTTKYVTPQGLGNTVLGLGQNYSVPGRSLGVTYTNSTGRTKFIIVSLTSPGGPALMNGQGLINGSVVSNSSWYANAASYTGSILLIVPPGFTYRVNAGSGAPTLDLWWELG